MDKNVLKIGESTVIINQNGTAKEFRFGLSWDDAVKLDDTGKIEKKGFLASLKNMFVHGHDDKKKQIKHHIDLDFSVLLMNSMNKVTEDKLIYFGKPKSKCGSVAHLGDNVAHNLKNDDNEIISINFETLPEKITKMIFVINIFNAKQKNQHLEMAKDIVFRVIDTKNETEVARTVFNGYEGKATILAADVTKNDGIWALKINGLGTDDDSVEELETKYR